MPINGNVQELIDLLYVTGSIKFGKFKLSSGKESNVYIDMRNALSYVKLRSQVVELMTSKARHLDHDLVVGIATGGLPWATLLAYKEEKPLSYVRESKKEHGTERLIEGHVTNMKCLMIDDVATTGKSLFNAIELVKAHGGIISYALVIVDRNEGAKETLMSIGVKLESLFTLDDILNYGIQKGFVR